MGTGELNAGGNPAMDQHPIQGGVEILLVASPTETGISSGLMGHLAACRLYLFLPIKTQSNEIDPTVPRRKIRTIESLFPFGH